MQKEEVQLAEQVLEVEDVRAINITIIILTLIMNVIDLTSDYQNNKGVIDLLLYQSLFIEFADEAEVLSNLSSNFYFSFFSIILEGEGGGLIDADVIPRDVPDRDVPSTKSSEY
ncbi:MAG: hypothetical protein EZS28_013217 [Streblomastix strix]|uniref:Uncharacterized protein n=1 Tax=Streblomastix strix TaxID=222440 RepID=A0A5J4W8L1_9EUKA|nr:MAG: hypothetical protein EZS28_013217 [Streblomastix strix]